VKIWVEKMICIENQISPGGNEESWAKKGLPSCEEIVGNTI
jgi:hypothetical protein